MEYESCSTFFIFLKTDRFLLIITLSLSTTNIFAMIPLLPRPDRGEGNSDSRTENQQIIERQNVAREEDASGNTSSTEQRGRTLAATEAVVITPEEQANNRIGITPTTLRMLRSRQAMESRQLPVAIANNNQDQLIPPENILNVISPVEEAEIAGTGMVTVHPETEIVENNDIKPIAMSDYLDILRKELKERQGLPLAGLNLEIDDQQLEQDEIALNQAVLENGVTPEELRVLRALENHAISDSIFAETHRIAVRRRLERISNTSPHGPYMADFQASVARENANIAAMLTQQTEQEREDAINAIIGSERGYTPVVATPLEETSGPLLRRQTYSL